MILRKLVVMPFSENIYIVGSEQTRECVVIDPGADGAGVLGEIARLGLKVKLILNTHGHGDHVAAVAAVKEGTGAPYAIHPGDKPLLKSAYELARSYIKDFREPPEPDMELKDGDTIEVGETKLMVLETPGHTPGGVCLYGDGLVFTGDTLFQGSIGRFDLPGGDGRQLLASITTKLLTLPDETRVLPGHGPETSIGREKQHNPFLTGGIHGLD